MKKTLKKALSEVVNKHLSQIFDEQALKQKKFFFFCFHALLVSKTLFVRNSVIWKKTLKKALCHKKNFKKGTMRKK